MNQGTTTELPIPADTVIDRIFRASQELADALAAYRRLQARLDEERLKRQSAVAGLTSAEMRGEPTS